MKIFRLGGPGVGLTLLLCGLFYEAICCMSYLVSFCSCFSVLLALWLPRLGKRELILVLFVRLFDLCLFGFVSFLFLLVSGKGCGLWLWHSLDFSLTFFFFFFFFFFFLFFLFFFLFLFIFGCKRIICRSRQMIVWSRRDEAKPKIRWKIT